MNPDVFREYDIRGIVDKDLTQDIVYQLGRAIGTCSIRNGVRTMVLGRDCRLSSERYQDAIGDGIRSSGVDVIEIGLCATPMLYFAIRHLQTDGGVMVTGSHNPPDFNGFKVCIGPDTIYGSRIQDLRRIVESKDFINGKGKSSLVDITGFYEDYLFSHVNVSSGLRIALDGGNGVGGFFALPLLKRLGCIVHDIHCDPDGRFPNHFPDPTITENLRELIHLVLRKNADAGIAYDGDGDRIGVITDRGEILWGDELLLLFARSILIQKPGAAIIGEVKCSQKLFDDIARHGGRPIMWKAGHSLIKGKMKEENALLAGEMSGHIFFADRYFGFDDALYASVRLLEILSETGQSLSALLSDVPKTYATPEIRIECPDRVKFQVVESFRIRYQETHQMITIDGLRILFPDGWALIRSSNTQPVIVMRFEASSQEALSFIRDEVESMLHNVMKSF